MPGLADDAAQSLVAAVSRVRALRLIKPPGIAETIEWGQAAKVLADEGSAWPLALRRSLGLLLKEQEDTEAVLDARGGARALNAVLDGFLADWAADPGEADRLPHARCATTRRPTSRACTGWRG